MTSHPLVDPFERKEIPDSTEVGIWIPLSLGDPREDWDKNGDPCVVFDFMWNPDTIAECKNDQLFKQSMIDIAFQYVQEKFKRVLNPKYTIPKLKYKGATVQYQRVRAKKVPKIETLKTQELTKEE